MKLKSLVLLIVALGCGLVAMLGVQQVLTGPNGAGADEEMVDVLIAANEIRPGFLLDGTNTTFKSIPASQVPEGAVTDAKEYEERCLKFHTFAGEIILQEKLGAKGERGASIEIPKGMRVVTVPCDATMIHSGMVRPGDRIDVLVTFKASGPQRRSVSKTRTVLEFIEVFATDNVRDAFGGTEAQEFKAKNLSLLVTPNQANLLTLAKSEGQLSLSLRAKTDDEKGQSTSVTKKDLDDRSEFGKQNEDGSEKRVYAGDLKPKSNGDVQDFLKQEQTPAIPAPPKKIANMWKIEIYKGQEKVVEEVELPEEEIKKAADGALNDFMKGLFKKQSS